MSLTKENFFSIKPKVKKLDLAGTSESIYARPLTLEQRNHFAKLASEKKEGDAMFESLSRLTLYLVISSVCDADGKLLFSEEDEEQLKQMDGEMMISLQDEILDISGLTVKSRETLEKNSQETSTESEQSSQ